MSTSTTPTTSTESKKMMKLTLKPDDGDAITIEEDIAFQSNLLKKMVTDLGITDPDSPSLQEPLPVSNVSNWTLKKILDWCSEHRGQVYKPKEEHEDPRIKLTEQDEEYMNVTSDQLLDMLLAANYLDIPGIIDIITQKIANMITGKTVEEIREIYGLENDFTPEEEEELRNRFAWVEV